MRSDGSHPARILSAVSLDHVHANFACLQQGGCLPRPPPSCRLRAEASGPLAVVRSEQIRCTILGTTYTVPAKLAVPTMTGLGLIFWTRPHVHVWSFGGGGHLG